MPKSLSIRFNGNGQEVVEYCRQFGRFRAMDKYGVKDYIAFSKFIERETGKAEFGLVPSVSGRIPKDGDEFVENLLRAIHRMKSENEKLTQEIEFLKWHKEHGTHKGLGALAQVCES